MSFRKRSKCGGLNPDPLPPDNNIEQKFDADSGLVYSESQVRLNRRKYLDWIGEPRTPLLVKEPRPNGHGARSLADMARNKVITRFRDLTLEHFAVVPWSLAESIWNQLVAMRSESFHAWRTLAAAYPGPEDFGKPEYRFLLELKQPLLPMSNYFSAITSAEPNWLTCLRISPKQLTTPELVAVHTISNLTVLDLSDGQVTITDKVSTFDERVMRSWAELAASGRAFQHLRVLLCGWQEKLSGWIFNYVDSFPSLCYIVVTDCPLMHQKNRGEWEDLSEAVGWVARHAKKSAKSVRPIIGSEQFGFGSISGWYYDTMDLVRKLERKGRSSPKGRMPLLEIWLGTPRQWSHIIDDFPSTRTIFFENIKTRDGVAQRDHAEVRTRDQGKRPRNQENPLHGTASPPSKRNPHERPALKMSGKTVGDMLKQFQD